MTRLRLVPVRHGEVADPPVCSRVYSQGLPDNRCENHADSAACVPEIAAPPLSSLNWLLVFGR